MTAEVRGFTSIKTGACELPEWCISTFRTPPSDEPTMAGSSACHPPSYRAYSLSRWTDKAEVEREMGWKKLLAYITGSVGQALLLQHEYLMTENDLSAHPILT